MSRYPLVPTRSHLASVVAAVVLALAAIVPSSGTVLAQGITIDCASYLPAGTVAASPAAPVEATPGPSDAEQVAFPADGGELTVFAAASLTAAFEAIALDIATANPGVGISFNFAGSQVLVTQLSEGAEADVFASASSAQMAAAQEAGVIAGEPVVFTQNRLTIVVPADNPAGVTTYADLAGDLDLVLALPEVPVGQYARQSICTAANDSGTYGDGFAEAVASNVVSEEDSVKAVLTKVSLGEADAGIVYTTDITPDLADSVSAIGIPAEVNVPGQYPIAVVNGGDDALAAAFIAWVTGPDGQATLAEFGFEPKP
ncbi:MAG: molybdate ABC transporter substrate-binding protein [Chloroflexota bacterium]|nr:molybdate ABC transporter substrate-binding protein [Chloroflexota bacterium]